MVMSTGSKLTATVTFVVGLLMGTLGVNAGVNEPASTSAGEIHAQTTSPSLSPSGQPLRGVGWPITTTSGKAEIALARHLTQIGAKEYGAWWCPHCHEQKQLFGKQAFKKINYIECDADGKNAQPNLCQAANIQGFPTWEINGQLYPGVQSLQRLAQLSGYRGSDNFKNFPQAFYY